MISLTGLAETYIIGSAGTKALFGSSLAEFVTGRTHHNGDPSNALSFNPGQDGYSVSSLPELLGFTKNGFSVENIGGTYGNKTFGDMVTTNLKRNGLRSAGIAILTPIAFRGGKKLMKKPIRELNKMLKGTGVRI
jgi:hypothetical protein